MTSHHFAFLQAEWPSVYEAAAKAEAAAYTDPRTSCFYARRALELVVHWVYKHDAAIELPYQDNLSSLIHDPTFQKAAGEKVFQKAKFIVRYGNQAVHSPKAVLPMEAQSTLRELFHVCFWLAHTYARGAKPSAELQFDPTKLPTGSQLPKQTVDQLLKLETQLRERDEKLSELLADKGKLDAVLTGLRAEIAEIKKANTAAPDAHDYSEEETRDQFIDLMLKEAGWALDQKRDREFEVDGMPNAKGKGKVDYVLWGDDGLPLALVEAKRTRKDARVGQQQAKLYADCLEAKFGRRPVIFYTNGYEHWLWDDATYPPRAVQGFYKKDELELLIRRRTSRKTLKGVEINDKIVERYYQTRAIRRLGEAFETGRVFVSTYPTMMGLIDDTRDGLRRFGVGHFDLIVIDEAHRSVFQKYRAIFDYFDSLLVGLTATPKGDVDRNTYGLFNLETGVPTDAYPLEDAVKDGYLVPAKAVSVPLKFPQHGIKKYDDLSEQEQEQWDEIEWDEEGGVPDEVDAAAVNAWLFNKDTVDKALEYLMTKGLKVAGGDRLGKTILFAKNQKHADFIYERFDANYPHLKGEFARVITFNTVYAQSLIDAFSIKEKSPHIAISVDMLDTGIDVPEVVNLVFFKPVRSKTKFWQMVGRGTRLCPNLFGPDKHKTEFYIFDFCGNLEFFSANPDTADGSAAESLGKRLFKARLELVGVLDKKRDSVLDAGFRDETAEHLRGDLDFRPPGRTFFKRRRRFSRTAAVTGSTPIRPTRSRSIDECVRSAKRTGRHRTG